MVRLRTLALLLIVTADEEDAPLLLLSHIVTEAVGGDAEVVVATARKAAPGDVAQDGM